MLTVHGDLRSGNCLKVKYLADHLGIEYRWRDVDILAGESRTEAFLALNPAGQIPLVEFDDGRTLAQSNAILLHLGRGSSLVPDDPWRLAKTLEWLFWEQYSHEPAVAVARFQVVYRGLAPDALDPALAAKSEAALDRLDAHLSGRRWLVDDAPTVADLSLVAYSRLAPEAGFDLGSRAALGAWIGRVEDRFGIAG